MRKCFVFQLLFLLILGNIQSIAQTTNLQQLNSFSGSFIKLVRSIDKEKAYLVTYKSIYTAGEPIWFRSFLLHNISNKISVQSSILFTTNDIPGHYKIIITGITIHGDLIYHTISFTNL